MEEGFKATFLAVVKMAVEGRDLSPAVSGIPSPSGPSPTSRRAATTK
jgi:hypothetical protein